MNSRISLDKKVVLITGGYGHLGAGITEGILAHDGIAIVLGRSQDKFEQLRAKLNNHNNLHFQPMDVSDLESVKQAYSNVFLEFNRIDVLINNAYFGKSETPEKMSDQDFLTGIDGALSTVFRCTREVLPWLKENGRIINISSMYGSVSPDFRIYENCPEFQSPPNYGAAKAAIQQLTRYFANYLGPKGITVNSVSPGPFPNPTVQKNTEFIKNLEQKTALRRIGKPKDLEGICAFLASEFSSYITGQNIAVDGGWTIS
jgi:gluconate 5-dehydrogenase